jgi:hypothetical protein
MWMPRCPWLILLFPRDFGSLNRPSQVFVSQGDCMTVIHANLFSVSEKFPDRKKTIIRLFRQSEPFQTVCEDYQSCAAALRHWEKSDSEEALSRREEYAALLRDLEGEILQFLDESE